MIERYVGYSGVTGCSVIEREAANEEYVLAKAYDQQAKTIERLETENRELDAAVTALCNERDWYHDRLTVAEKLLREADCCVVCRDAIDAFLNQKDQPEESK